MFIPQDPQERSIRIDVDGRSTPFTFRTMVIGRPPWPGMAPGRQPSLPDQGGPCTPRRTGNDGREPPGAIEPRTLETPRQISYPSGTMLQSDQLPGSAAAPAICAADGELSFGQLREAAARAAGALLDGAADLAGARVCFLVPPSCDYVVTLHGIFRAGGIAVPLGLMHPEPELAWILDDTRPGVVVAHPDCAARRRATGPTWPAPAVDVGTVRPAPASLPEVGPDCGALIVYATTGRRRACCVHAIWQRRSAQSSRHDLGPRDRMHALPLHHIQHRQRDVRTTAGASCRSAAVRGRDRVATDHRQP